MEKRTEAQSEDDSNTRRFMRSRAVLQKALQLNPGSARICQAWGLLELQAGNMWAALALLERASRTDARCAPVGCWPVACWHDKGRGSCTTQLRCAWPSPEYMHASCLICSIGVTGAAVAASAGSSHRSVLTSAARRPPQPRGQVEQHCLITAGAP